MYKDNSMNKLIEKFESLQEKLAVILSDSLSSMTMFWIITLLVIIPLFFNQPSGLVAWMQYIVSVFFQGVALPVLGYIAKISGSRTDAIISKIEELSEKIEAMTEHISTDVDDIKEHVDDIDVELKHVDTDVDNIQGDLKTVDSNLDNMDDEIKKDNQEDIKSNAEIKDKLKKNTGNTTTILVVQQ